MILNYLAFIAISAGFNVGLLIVAEKYDLTSKYDYYKTEWMPKRCEFCACYWCSVLQATFMIVLESDIFKWYYLYPLCFVAAAYSLVLYRR